MITVSIVGINDIVIEGDPLKIVVDVTNTGVEPVQDVEIKLLDFNGNVVDSVILFPSTGIDYFESGETEQITLTWNLEPGDTNVNTITVKSPDDSATKNILGLLSYNSGITYIEQGNEKRHIAQVNFLTYKRNVADKISNRLQEVISEVGQEVINRLKEDI